MNGKTTTLIFLLVSSASLAGCVGEDNLDTIAELEQDVLIQIETIEALNLTVQSMQGMILELNETILSLNGQNTALDVQILTYLSDIEDLNIQINQYLDQISLLKQFNTSKTVTIDQLNDDIVNLNLLITQLNSQIYILELQVSNLFTQEQIDAAYDEGRAQGIAENSPVSTLDTIIERGSLKCGVKESQYGMGYVDSDGIRSGLDISYCQAIAAAIGLNPMDDIEYIPAAAYNRFELLSDGSIDVLIRTTTWTTSRDASLDVDFAAVNFYDGQGLLIRGDQIPDDGDYSPNDLDEISICVGTGTTTEGNLIDWANDNNLTINAVYVDSSSDAIHNLEWGYCNAISGDLSALISTKHILESDDTCGPVADPDDNDCDGLWIAPEILSKEPLAAATRDYDSEWNEVVSWVWYGMITAEELGINSTNYVNADTSDSDIQRLLDYDAGLGTQDNPLPANWMQSVLSAVGNYGEIYDNAFCDGTYDGYSGSNSMTGCLMPRSGTLNALASEGGLQYAPPMK